MILKEKVPRIQKFLKGVIQQTNPAKTTGFVYHIRKKNGPEQIKNHLYLIIKAGPGASPQKVLGY